jgi:hypothetical protein
LRARRFSFRPIRAHPDHLARQLLALFLSVHFDLGIGGIALLDRNPHLLGYFTRRFTAQLGTVTAPPSSVSAAWALAEGPRWAASLMRTITLLSKRAQDEELMVVIADFTILPPRELKALSQCIGHGRAYGHRFVVFWPDFGPPLGGPLEGLHSRFAAAAPLLSQRLRALRIPAGPLRPDEGFHTVVRHVNLLSGRRGVRSW